MFNVKMLVIDSIGTLLSPILSTKQHSGRGLLTEISRLMKKIAQNHNIAFVVTNYAVGSAPGANRDQSTRLKAGLGEAWSYVPHSQIFLRHQQSNDEHKGISATLSRSTRNVRIEIHPALTYRASNLMTL